MSQFMTYLQLKTKVQNDLDLEDELFVSETEMLGYANEAVREAAAEIGDIYEDYFLKRATLTLVNGQEEYDLPADIYANKIRRIIYANGGTTYSVNRIRDWKKFEEYALANVTKSATVYNYFVTNASAGGIKLLLVPPAKEDGAFVTIWYLRECNVLAVDTDVCDIPEFSSFILQYMKVRCYEKEMHPNLSMAIAALEQQRAQMVATLTAMIPDADNEIEPDLSLYYDMS